LANFLKGPTTAQTLANIHQWVYNNFQYKAEGLTHDLQTLSRAFHEFREKGINCEDSTIIIVQLLSSLGIPSKVRRIHQASSPEVASHVYVIVPKKGGNTKASNDRRTYFTLDGTVPNFDWEAPFVKALDTKVPISPARGLNSVDASNNPNNGLVGNTIDVSAIFNDFMQKNPPPSEKSSELYGNLVGSVIGDDFGKAAEWYMKWQMKLADSLFGKTNDEEERLDNLIKSWQDNNYHELYPNLNRANGPWKPGLGAGALERMNRDELRYFIEFRMPAYGKYVKSNSENVWGKNTKTRVKNRYRKAARLMTEIAKTYYIAKYGCYADSGLYRDDLAKVPVGAALKDGVYGSYQIRSLVEKCGNSSSGSGSGSSLSKIKNQLTSNKSWLQNNTPALSKTNSMANKANFSSGLIGTIALLGIGLGLRKSLKKAS